MAKRPTTEEHRSLLEPASFHDPMVGFGPYRLSSEPIVPQAPSVPKIVLGALVALAISVFGAFHWNSGGAGLLIAVVVLYLGWLGLVWAGTRPRMVFDGDRLHVRRLFAEDEIQGGDVAEVRYVYNGRSPNMRLVSSAGRAVLIPCASLHHGHSGLFTWLGTYAPQAHYDTKSTDVRDALIIRGLIEG